MLILYSTFSYFLTELFVQKFLISKKKLKKPKRIDDHSSRKFENCSFEKTKFFPTDYKVSYAQKCTKKVLKVDIINFSFINFCF